MLNFSHYLIFLLCPACLCFSSSGRFFYHSRPECCFIFIFIFQNAFDIFCEFSFVVFLYYLDEKIDNKKLIY